ncbi:MAG TPA: NAD(P)-dependent oxidoreductase [Sphingobium sp.]
MTARQLIKGKEANMRIGWIGLGGIGTQMVKRLRAAGHDVAVYGRGAGLDEATAAGAAPCSSYAQLAGQSDILFLCVYSDAQMIDILFDQGALTALPPASTIVIHTTGSPATAQRIATAAPDGVHILDACFSGGPTDVAAGRLTLMIGGEAEALEPVRPLLETYASHIHHVGPLGHGQMLKLLNNLLFATNLMNAAELVRLAEQQGFPPALLAQVIGASSGASYALNLFASPGFTLAAMENIRPYLEKDVATAMTTAQEASLDVNAFKRTADYFRRDTQPAAQATK